MLSWFYSAPVPIQVKETTSTDDKSVQLAKPNGDLTQPTLLPNVEPCALITSVPNAAGDGSFGSDCRLTKTVDAREGVQEDLNLRDLCKRWNVAVDPNPIRWYDIGAGAIPTVAGILRKHIDSGLSHRCVIHLSDLKVPEQREHAVPTAAELASMWSPLESVLREAGFYIPVRDTQKDPALSEFLCISPGSSTRPDGLGFAEIHKLLEECDSAPTGQGKREVVWRIYEHLCFRADVVDSYPRFRVTALRKLEELEQDLNASDLERWRRCLKGVPLRVEKLVTRHEGPLSSSTPLVEGFSKITCD